MSKKKFLITIDGNASTGKSTIGKLVAKNINGVFISTGEIYRLITYWLLYFNIDLNNEKEVIKKFQQLNLTSRRNHKDKIEFLCNDKFVEDKLLCDNIISSNVSLVARISQVRQPLIQFQRNFSSLKDSLVVEGRDIGTVIFPNSHYKFFITATAKIRALRRLKQYKSNFTNKELKEMQNDITKRDEIDSSRQTSPTKQASDAIIIDNSNKTIEQTINQMMTIINNG